MQTETKLLYPDKPRIYYHNSAKKQSTKSKKKTASRTSTANSRMICSRRFSAEAQIGTNARQKALNSSSTSPMTPMTIWSQSMHCCARAALDLLCIQLLKSKKLYMEQNLFTMFSLCVQEGFFTMIQMPILSGITEIALFIPLSCLRHADAQQEDEPPGIPDQLPDGQNRKQRYHDQALSAGNL